MLAATHQAVVVGFEQVDVLLVNLGYIHPGAHQFVALCGVLQRLAVHADGPLLERLLVDAAVFLQPRQDVDERGPVLEPIVKPTEQGEGIAVIARVFLEAPQRRQRQLILAPVELELGLREQHGVGCLGRILEGELEPVVTTLIEALQVGGPGRLQVIEQRRIAAARGTRQQPFSAGEVALGNLDHAPRQFLAGTTGAIPAGRLSELPRRPPDLPQHPDRDQQHQDQADEHRH